MRIYKIIIWFCVVVVLLFGIPLLFNHVGAMFTLFVLFVISLTALIIIIPKLKNYLENEDPN